MRRPHDRGKAMLSPTKRSKRLLLPTLLVVLSLCWAGFGTRSTADTNNLASTTGAPAETASALAPLAPQAAPWTPPDPAYRVYVEADGMYRLDYATLSGKGLPVDAIDPNTFKIYWMGTEIAAQLTGNGDTQFEPGEALIFYGRSLDSLFYDGLVPTNKYTGTNIYWLTYGGAPGLRMAAKDGSASGSTPDPFPHRVHLEGNASYIPKVGLQPLPQQLDADRWYDFKVQPAGTPGNRNKFYTLNIQNHVNPAADGLLKVAMLGDYAGAHNLRLFVNGNKVFEQLNLWSGFAPVTVQASVLASYFLEGSNSIQVQIYNVTPKTLDVVYPNWVEVTYSDDYIAEGNSLAFENPSAGAQRYQVQGFSSPEIEAYDVTAMAAVQRFVNTTVGGSGPYDVSFGDSVAGASRYMAVATGGWLAPARIEQVVNRTSIYTPPNLLGAGFGADYIVISNSAFWSEALRLVQYRARDFRVVLVDVQRIYDQFNGGLMSAESIHDFLAYAYANWVQPAPAYVVLMGDGTSDFRDYLGGGAPIFIPPYLYLADPTLGETAAENRFVTLVGNDMAPDMHIGRLSVNTPQEAAAMVDKIIAYETQCSCGGWNYNTIFVADNLVGGGGNFYAYSDTIADGYADPPTNTIKLIPPAYTIGKLYLDSPNPAATCSQNPAATPPVTQCTDSLVSELNTTGALFVNYVGHGGKQAWAAEDLLTPSSVATLKNGVCLPIMLPMTCYEGSFHEPGATFTSLAEASTRMALDGSIASFSPTGFGLVSGHDVLERGLLTALLHDNVDRLGPAIDFAKRLLLAESPTNADLVDTFMLFGDPALQPKTDYVCSQSPTGVLLSTFAARRDAGGVRLSWLTASEADMVGFNVWRSEGDGAFHRLNEELLPAERAGSDNGDDYTYLDAGARAGRIYRYKLQVMKPDGTTQEYGPVAAPGAAPSVLYLPLVVRP